MKIEPKYQSGLDLSDWVFLGKEEERAFEEMLRSAASLAIREIFSDVHFGVRFYEKSEPWVFEFTFLVGNAGGDIHYEVPLSVAVEEIIDKIAEDEESEAIAAGGKHYAAMLREWAHQIDVACDAKLAEED